MKKRFNSYYLHAFSLSLPALISFLVALPLALLVFAERGIVEAGDRVNEPQSSSGP